MEYVYKDNTIFCCQFYNCNFWSDIACIALRDFSAVGEYDTDIPDSASECDTRLVSAAGHSVYSVCLVRYEDYDDADVWFQEYCFKVHRLEFDDPPVLILKTPNFRLKNLAGIVLLSAA